MTSGSEVVREKNSVSVDEHEYTKGSSRVGDSEKEHTDDNQIRDSGL